ncbi:MAG: class A beta-lactamase-related serine hydrolase [Planctomycetes bacterium]|nr:class A beta-lactamase-related serine hydrolase [Planctomycetota bacterium]
MNLARVLLLAVASSFCAPAAQEPPASDLTARIEAIRAKAGVPALGGALVSVDGLQGVWATGTRRAGGTEKVTPDDLWHLGSCTKAMTATLIALLVARGDLAWDTQLGELLPDLATEMHVDFLDLTLVELMSHRAGLPANPFDDSFEALAGKDLVTQRAAVTRTVLKAGPVHAPRAEFLYSNMGFLIAGHIAEVVTKKPWETLMQELLFTPLGMTSAGFGPPGTSASCDQPRGHTAEGVPVEPGEEADNPPAIGPAGTVHATLADWAKFIQLHLRGAREDVKVGALTLTKDTFTRLHTPYPGEGMQYGYGWVFAQRPWAGGDGLTLWHNGSNTMWYCVTWLGLANGFAGLATTTVFTPRSQGAADEVIQLMIQEAQAKAAKR